MTDQIFGPSNMSATERTAWLVTEAGKHRIMGRADWANAIEIGLLYVGASVLGISVAWWAVLGWLLISSALHRFTTNVYLHGARENWKRQRQPQSSGLTMEL